MIATASPLRLIVTNGQNVQRNLKRLVGVGLVTPKGTAHQLVYRRNLNV